MNKIILKLHFILAKYQRNSWLFKRLQTWIVEQNYLKKLGKKPDFEFGNDYNNKICWLMCNNFADYHIELSDKVKAKVLLAKIIGQEYIIPNIATGKKIDFRKIAKQNLDYVVKTNHDSGTVFFVEAGNEPTDKQKRMLQRSLQKRYGANKGEWHYQLIEPLILVEPMLTDAKQFEPADDYKFHCNYGEIVFVQYITGRKKNYGTENVFDTNGNYLDVLFCPYNQLGQVKSLPLEWREMAEISKIISEHMPYCRVDFYLLNGVIKIGEVTFFPFNGTLAGNGQVVLGKKIEFDRQ